ncbi:PBAN-type neuropeptides-like isoform X2 [Anopheles stephensi]|uniref:PBAN-type neuropeptides-like isoform X2 n=1 Tax=Anopheles stephensi TaxID=30069 RepID=UPI001658A1CF|nr:PBAN-type neuropeptides-like isoform X2 [Anopheles stephensi]
MFRFSFFFNLICLYLAIKSALSVEDQKFADLQPSGRAAAPDASATDATDGAFRREETADALSKRAAAMWFGPRLGKRTIATDLHDDLVEEFDSEPLGYAGEPPQRLAAELVQGAPYLVLLLTAKPSKPQPAFFHTTSPRLGRRDSVGENHQRPPFAPRLGRNLPFSPRLGRAYNGGYPLPFRFEAY